MTDEQRQLLQECKRIYIEEWLPAYVEDDSATTHEAVVAIMQRIDAVLGGFG